MATSPAAPAAPRATTASTEPASLAARLRLVIARLSRRVRQEGAVEGETLGVSAMAALASVERVGPLAVGELAAVERVQPPSMTRIVARLEEAGYATRLVDPADRRVARVEITSLGRDVLARGRTRKTAFLAQRVARLTDDERAIVAAALPLLERLQDDDA